MPLNRSRNSRYSTQRNFSYKPRSLRRIESQSKKKLIYLIIFCIILAFIMINWGLPLLIGSLSVFNGLKTTQKVTSPVDDTAISPPVLNIPYEATNSAVIQLSGYSEPNSKIEIYINDSLVKETETDSSGNFNISELALELGNNYIYGKTLNEQKQSSLPSKRISLFYSDEKPSLEVSEPSDNKEIRGGDKKVIVNGKTDPQNNLSINGSSVILNGDGTFSKEVSLNEGENNLSISASDQIGNNTQINRKVTYFP